MKDTAQDIEHPDRQVRPGKAHLRFSSYLRRLRKERKLSLRQVEKLSEAYSERISNSYLAYCETGRLLPSLAKLVTLSRVLGVPLQSLTERLEIDQDSVAMPVMSAGSDTLQGMRSAGIGLAEAGDLRRAYVCFERGLELAETAGDEGARVDLMMDMGILLRRMSRHYTARELLENVVSIRGLDGARMDRALILLADVLREMGKLPIAAMIGREALHRAVSLGDKSKEAHAACLLGNALFDMGDIEQAVPLYERAVRFFRDTRDFAPLVCNMANLANCLVKDARGARFIEGIRMLQEAESIARREGFSRHVADILGYLGQAHGRKGDSARAEKQLFQSNQLARAGEYHDILFSNTWHLRELALRCGRDSAAADLLRSLRHLRARVDNTNPETRAYDRLTRASDDTAPDGKVNG